ncbi:MAG: Hsp33 family molecular chaperone HslO [Steroidobacteraceae bacterium]
MGDNDQLRRFLFEDLPVRGQFVRLDASWRAIIEHQDYPTLAVHTLGEAMAASVLMAGTLKFEGRLLLQCQGQGPLRLLLAECTHARAIRGVARLAGACPESASLDLLTGGGQLSLTIENPERDQRYQGVVPMEQAQLAGCLEAYFERSEQLPSRLMLAATRTRAAGLLLQRIPAGEEGEEPTAEAWERLGLLLATLTAEELLHQPCEVILHRLFNEDDLRLFEGEPVFFQCACSRERVEGILQSLGAVEVEAVLAEQGRVEVRCEFCNRAWTFDAVDVGRVMAAAPATSQGAGPH